MSSREPDPAARVLFPDDTGPDESGRDDTYSVAELSTRIARAAAEAFPGDLWVSGQIRNLKRSNNGHVYFDLVEPCEMGALPTSILAVTLLAPERVSVNNQLRRAGGSIRMDDGVEIRIQARLRWYEPRGSLQLRMSAIDPAFTLGRLKADRDRVLATLSAQGLIEANKARPLAPVPLRVALITSTGTAAHADVTAELSASGLAFDLWLLDVRTQGLEAVAQIVSAFGQVNQAISQRQREVDVVLLVRGGGASTDLAVFDDEAVARAVAGCAVPVFCGIGHEIDRSIADEVAHSSHKTPTAAAGAVIDRVRQFLIRLDQAGEAVRRAALATTGEAERRLHLRTVRVGGAVERTLRSHDTRLTERTTRIHRAAERSLAAADRDLQGRAARARAHDPALALARGWTITTGEDGRAVKSVAQLTAGDRLFTRFADGTVASTVDPASSPEEQQ